MKGFLFILNEPPYGSEKPWNALRLALTLARQQDADTIRIFLLGDSVIAAKHGQKVAQGYYNLESMLKGLVSRGVNVVACGTCMDARGLGDDDLIKGISRGSMDQLGEWSLWADSVLVF
ncbi:MAG: DsrE-like protein [Thermoplasmatales archaeon I-plasma]|nr:MAG: DsrE-like protein [Thermoplasmatales archaeon I-plasma]EQB69413.1 MAG: DsrE-like protein [Thermoplasmatales archaeon A-plasma]